MGRAASRLPAVALATGLAVAGLGGCTSQPKPDGVAAGYLAAWSRGDLAGAARLTDNSVAARAALDATKASLGARVRASRQSVVTKDKRATADFAAAWPLPGLTAPWSYRGQLSLVLGKGGWRVHWVPSDISPRLGPGQRLTLIRTLPPRAPLLDAAAQPMFVQTDTVTVGIEPRQVKDLPSLVGSLAAALHIDPAPIRAAVSAARPTDFVPVITLRASDYARVRAAIHDLPGTVFRSGQQVLPPSPRFAQPLLGTVGEATAEVLAEVGPAYRGGDQLGRSGLQRAFNRQLAGTASGRVEVVDSAGRAVATVGSVPGSAGTSVRLTLDRATQLAADSALSDVRLPAAIVAVRPSTGAILAVANSAAAPFDIALAGQYPAGSTFKIVTATAALAGSLVTPTASVACPGTVTIGGRTIPNENKFALGTVPLRTAFAKSCNTTFAALGDRLDPAAFRRTAAGYGIGAGWQLPVASFSGSVAVATDPVERAFDAIGQGRVLVSPLAEALMAATVQRGSVPAPSLLAGRPAKADRLPPAPAPPAVLATLQDFARAVVTEGTATALAGVPGGPVAGKTGTAEFGTTTPPQAHSWFTGYQGDLAFAVFVYGGQTSQVPANPLARAFLAALHRS